LIDSANGAINQTKTEHNITLYSPCINTFGLYNGKLVFYISSENDLLVINAHTGELETTYKFEAKEFNIENMVYDFNAGVLRAISYVGNEKKVVMLEIANNGAITYGPNITELNSFECQGDIDPIAGNYYVQNGTTLIAIDIFNGDISATFTFPSNPSLMIQSIDVGYISDDDQVFVVLDDVFESNPSQLWNCYYFGDLKCSHVLNFPVGYKVYNMNGCFTCNTAQLYVILYNDSTFECMFVTVDPFGEGKIIETSPFSCEDYSDGGVYSLFCEEEYC